MLRILALAAALLLAGCSLLPGKPVTGRPTADAFELKGRIAVRFDGDGYSGTVWWRHAKARDVVELYTPIGTLYARLTRDGLGAVMEAADGKRYEEADAQALSLRVLGWELPLDSLPFWLFAQSAPGGESASVTRGPDGRPGQLDQHDWRVRYRGYFEDFPGYANRVDLDRAGLNVKLIVSTWQGGK